jgi:Fic family protein
MMALSRECVFETLRLTGAPSSRDAISRAAARGGQGEESALIRGQFDALGAIERDAQSGPTLTPALVCEVHRLSAPSSDGSFRRQPIAGQFSAATPSRPDLIGEKLANLCEWLGVDSGRAMHPPEKAALAFARLLEISPFDSGNFRTAHLLLSFFGFVENYPPLFFRLEEAEEVRADVERAMVFDTLPLVERLSRALERSLSFCFDYLDDRSNRDTLGRGPGP